jgi:ketosteroid isomerase-like protein
MSQENVELIHRVFDALTRGDLDSAFESAADDYVVDWSNSIGPARGVYRGQERSGSSGPPSLRPSTRSRGSRRRLARSTSGPWWSLPTCGAEVEAVAST